MVLFAVFWLAPATFAEHRITPDFAEKIFVSKPFLRTELYFGTIKADGSPVTDDEWQNFLTGEVTPRFPDGFTILTGYGQFRDSGGKIVRENSIVLIVLYPLQIRKSNSRKIEQIRRAYLKTFRQQSVMRVDYLQTVQVSF